MMVQEAEEVGLVFFLKKTKNSNAKLRFVYVRVTVDGVRKEWSTKKKWYPGRWNQKIGRATDNKEDAKTLNKYLDLFALQVTRTKNNLIERDKDVDAMAVKKALTGPKEPERTLLGEFKIHNDQMQATVGKKDGAAKGTHDRYTITYNHTLDFIKYKYDKDDISLRGLDYEFIADFAHWLQIVRDCAHNTTRKYLANMKKVVLIAVKKGFLKRDPFIGFSLKLLPVTRPRLSMEELIRIMNKDFDNERLSVVRDIFVFACFTGLAFIDVLKLRRQDILELNGRKWIQIARTKSKVQCQIPILDQAQKILDLYSTDKLVVTKGVLIPSRSNQRLNSYLKEIADVCGINKTLTFHIARHTFATTIATGYGITLATLAAILGHKKLPQTQHYAIIEHKTIEKEMERLQIELNADMNKRQIEGIKRGEGYSVLTLSENKDVPVKSDLKMVIYRNENLNSAKIQI